MVIWKLVHNLPIEYLFNMNNTHLNGWLFIFQSLRLVLRSIRTEVSGRISWFAESKLFIRWLLEWILLNQYAFRVKIVAEPRNLKTFVYPVSVLLNNVPVKFVSCKSCAFPPRVRSSSPPCSYSCHSHNSKVLIKLSLVDFSNTKPSYRNKMFAHAMGIEHKHWAESPNTERSKESVGLQIALKKILKVSCEG